MRRMRTGLLLALAVALLAASPLSAQVAPTLTGETGLFGIYDAQTVPQGRFAFSVFYSMYDRTAAPVPNAASLADDPMRYSSDKLGLTIAFGLFPNWEASFSTGQRRISADNRLWSGNFGGRNRVGEVKHDETDKLRFGTKLLLNPNDPVKIALFGAAYLPTQRKSDPDALTTYRTDWEWGFSATYGIFTGQFTYLWTSDWGVEMQEYDVANEMTWSAGVGVPIIPDRLKGIFELHRTMYDGGTTQPPDFTDAVLEKHQRPAVLVNAYGFWPKFLGLFRGEEDDGHEQRAVQGAGEGRSAEHGEQVVLVQRNGGNSNGLQPIE